MSVVPRTPITSVLAEDVDWDVFRASIEGSCRIIGRYRTLTSASADEEQTQLVQSIATCSQEYIKAVGESVKIAEHTSIICSDVLQFFDIKKHYVLDDEVKFSRAVEASAATAYGNAGLVHAGFRSVRRELVEVHKTINAWRQASVGNMPAVCAEKQTLTLDILVEDLEEALKHSERLEANVNALVSWWQRIKSLAQALRSGPAKNAQVSEEIRELMDRRKWEQLRNASGYYVDQVHKFSDAHNLGFDQIPSVLPSPTEDKDARKRLTSFRQVINRLRPRTWSGVNSNLVEEALRNGMGHEEVSRHDGAPLVSHISGHSGSSSPSHRHSTSDDNSSPITTTTTTILRKIHPSGTSTVSGSIAGADSASKTALPPQDGSRVAGPSREAVDPEAPNANPKSRSSYCGCCTIMTIFRNAWTR